MKPHGDSPLARALFKPPRISPEEATRRVAKELLSRRGAIRWYRLVAIIADEIRDIQVFNDVIDRMVQDGYVTLRQTWIRKNDRTRELL